MDCGHVADEAVEEPYAIVLFATFEEVGDQYTEDGAVLDTPKDEMDELLAGLVQDVEAFP